MKVIALIGESNSGKTTTLTMVYELLVSEKWDEDHGKRKELNNGDFLTVLEKDNVKIGLVTQGDYAKTVEESLPVWKYLEKLDNYGCSIAVCACTTGPSKNRIKTHIDKYNPHYITKTELPNNKNKVKEVLLLLNKLHK